MSDAIRLCLAGDVMTGRGIDQILPDPVDPALYEGWVRSAERYVELAEQASGPIPRDVAPDYIWGDALDDLARRDIRHRIVNLETVVTTHAEPAPKGINYRMSPANASVLTAAGIGIATLANNHVLDWGQPGLDETLRTLDALGIATAGAGADADAAAAPAIRRLAGAGRLLVLAYGIGSSGIPADWAATETRPGLARLPDLSGATLDRVARHVRSQRAAGDLVVVSIHWGPNWGYRIPAAHRHFAHGLIDAAGVDAVYGHSSHHPLGLEVYRGRPILYGCGDLLNDYEGIGGHGEVRPDLSLLYLPTFAPGPGALVSLDLLPYRIRRFRLEAVAEPDRRWLAARLTRESRRFGIAVEMAADGSLAARW